jgi:ABC-type branched-subunit amino acid transport system ATPase component
LRPCSVRERDADTAILLIEQNVAFALAIADRCAVLKRGAGDQGTIAAETASGIAQHFPM